MGLGRAGQGKARECRIKLEEREGKRKLGRRTGKENDIDMRKEKEMTREEKGAGNGKNMQCNEGLGNENRGKGIQ